MFAFLPPLLSAPPRTRLTRSRVAHNSTLNGVVLKYAEPPEARKPVRNWRLYVFKGKEQVGEAWPKHERILVHASGSPSLDSQSSSMCTGSLRT